MTRSQLRERHSVFVRDEDDGDFVGLVTTISELQDIRSLQRFIWELEMDSIARSQRESGTTGDAPGLCGYPRARLGSRK